MLSKIAPTNMSFLPTVVWYDKPNRSKNHTTNPFITCCLQTWNYFQSWDLNISNIYLFTNEFWIEFEDLVYSF